MQVYSDTKEYIKYKLNEFGFNEADLLVSNFNSQGSSFQFISDLLTKKIEFVSDNVTDVLGIKPMNFKREVFLRRIYPDDVAHVKYCEEMTTFFYSKFIEKSASYFYRVSYQFRLKTKHKIFEHFLNQVMLLPDNQSGRPHYILTNTSKINLSNSLNCHGISFLDSRNKKSYVNISRANDLMQSCSIQSAISNREVNVIKLLSEGYTSKEIGKILNISYDTVRTHRNNILKKTRFKTLMQVVSYYIRNELI